MKTEMKAKVQTYEEWHETYQKKELINVKGYLDSNDIEILAKLGIEIENKIYTCREFDVLYEECNSYYIDDDMSEEEIRESKSLDGTGVTRSEYNWVLGKFEKMRSEINYDA